MYTRGIAPGGGRRGGAAPGAAPNGGAVTSLRRAGLSGGIRQGRPRPPIRLTVLQRAMARVGPPAPKSPRGDTNPTVGVPRVSSP